MWTRSVQSREHQQDARRYRASRVGQIRKIVQPESDPRGLTQQTANRPPKRNPILLGGDGESGGEGGGDGDGESGGEGGGDGDGEGGGGDGGGDGESGGEGGDDGDIFRRAKNVLYHCSNGNRQQHGTGARHEQLHSIVHLNLLGKVVVLGAYLSVLYLSSYCQ